MEFEPPVLFTAIVVAMGAHHNPSALAGIIYGLVHIVDILAPLAIIDLNLATCGRVAGGATLAFGAFWSLGSRLTPEASSIAHPLAAIINNLFAIDSYRSLGPEGRLENLLESLDLRLLDRNDLPKGLQIFF